MKSTKTKLMFMLFWLILSAFIIAACSTEEMDDLEVDLSSERELDEGVGLKKAGATQNQILAEIRRATAKYHDLYAAEVDGYDLDPHCVEHPEFGGMGHHAVNIDRIIPGVDPSKPGVLVYEPMKNGRYRLVAVEFLVPAEPWDENPLNEGPPMLGEIEFDDHREIIEVDGVPVNAKGGPPFPHYQLHVWVWKNNPNGMYSPFNPNVSCQ
jgi:hypothetical protein